MVVAKLGIERTYRRIGDVERVEAGALVEREGLLTAPLLLLDRTEPEEPEETEVEPADEEVVERYTLRVEVVDVVGEVEVDVPELLDLVEVVGTVVLTGEVLGRV